MRLRTSVFSAFLSATSLFATGLAGAAEGSENTAGGPEAAATPEASTSEGGLEEIVVHAQRRAENQQTVPVSVSSIGPSELAVANVTTALDIGKLVPSLAVTSNSGTVLLFMRGVGSNVSAIGSEASVAVYVDGVYYSRLIPPFMRLNSIDHIEVLNGPQGTLFGRNASGGLLNIITKDPVLGGPFSLDSNVGYGNYQTVDASTYGTGSIGSRVAYDVAVDYHDQGEGYGRDLPTGRERPVDRSLSLRSKWLAQVTDTTLVKLTGEYLSGHENVGKQTNYRGFPQGYLDGSGPLPAVGFFDSNTDWSDVDSHQYYGASFRVEQDLGFSTLIDTVAYHDIRTVNPFDVDLSPKPLESTWLHSVSHDLLNELQLLSSRGSPVDWAAGVFFMNQNQAYNPAAFGGDLIDGEFGTPAGSGTTYQIYSRSQVKSIAPYAQARFEIAPKLKATLGARYNHDKLSGSGYQAFNPGGSDTVITLPGSTSSSEQTFTKVTWKGGLDYQFTDTLFGYASASRGYKGATLNLLPFDPTPTKPEVLDAYEVGIKSEWLDHRLRINGSAFYYKIKDPQVIVIAAAVTPTVKNAGAEKVKGLELQFDAVPVDNLTLRLAGTYLDAKYTDYTNAAFYYPAAPYGNNAAVQGNADGNYLPFSPRVSMNVGGEYRWPLANQASLALGANYAYSTKQYFQPDNVVSQSAYGLLDAHLTYDVGSTPLTFKLWGANLTDKHYYNGLVEFAGPPGNIGFVGAPRTYGINVNYKLGGESGR